MVNTSYEDLWNDKIGINSCYIEIYQDSKRYNCYFCKATLGQSLFVGLTSKRFFLPTTKTLEIMLNGNGATKARKKLSDKLRKMKLNPDRIIFLDKDSELVNPDLLVKSDY
jgi:hypothetical protein